VKKKKQRTPLLRAWGTFQQWVQKARVQLDADQCVPVALIALPIREVNEEDGSVDLDVHNGRILWPSDFPPSERGPLLLRLAKPYFHGSVLAGEDGTLKPRDTTPPPPPIITP